MSLKLENLTLQLAEFTLSVSTQLSAPITGLFGRSGSGKTTLLEIIAGIRRPSAGRIVLNDQTLTDIPQNVHIPPAKRQVGYVPQDLALFPHLNASANLHYGFRAVSANSTLPGRVIELLELSTLLSRPIQRLSGGEQQRIALGRALLASPKLLLLDEPLSSLDDRLKERILPYFKAIHDEFKIPMIYVTHCQWELTKLCDEVLTLHQGQLQPN
ncbi:ATP-binding cassette domain-containing protein [Phragmitibacter flavus]|uniref:ATP-binding cassette domain-containing protein n=1 Tax=Phragmitibacter flavus TaxID=2576071 RepID=A0A5R8KH00_9BACT|nr:ATP-binding cassette domain-containing protein [Phragmitibacter flavus]TLD70879.1 ATP-binding cassette domain-containing protein [Phragmitibacter flavus]